ncbi:DUF6053 domain-containing protein [Lysobacter enzymogenes]
MGGPSGPTLSGRVTATCQQSVGPEGPPTKAGSFGLQARLQKLEASD